MVKGLSPPWKISKRMDIIQIRGRIKVLPLIYLSTIAEEQSIFFQGIFFLQDVGIYIYRTNNCNRSLDFKYKLVSYFISPY